MIRFAVAVTAAVVAVTAIASAAPPPRSATTGASAFLLRITIPGQDTVALGDLEWPNSTTADVQSFQYPADGSVASVGRSRAAVFASPGSAATTQSFAETIVVSLFNGEIVAGKVTAAVSAGASERSVGAATTASGVQGLRALGNDVASTPGATASLAIGRNVGPAAISRCTRLRRLRCSAPYFDLPELIAVG